MKVNTKEKTPLLIAVDQGNAAFKTSNTVIPTHVFEILDDDILEDGRKKINCDGKTYIETTRMIPQCDSKTNEKFKILTMVSIGEEILASGKTNKVIEEDIALLLGVPNDKNFKAQDARELQKYYGLPKNMEFDYQGHHFKLTIKEVSVYRQGKAIMSLIPVNRGKVTIIDLGGQTTDVVHYNAESQNVVYSGMLDRDAGMKGLIRTVANRISTLDNKVRPEDFQEYLITGHGLGKDQTGKAQRYITGWVEEMISSISEEICEGLSVQRFGKIYLAGGGASVLEPYIRETLIGMGVQDSDIKMIQEPQTANARAYVQIKRKFMATANGK